MEVVVVGEGLLIGCVYGSKMCIVYLVGCEYVGVVCVDVEVVDCVVCEVW